MSPTPVAGPVPAPSDLLEGELTLVGRITGSSNATFVAEVGEHRVVYKPIAGERPLWDFPDGTLALREHATWVIARTLGWDVVPTTVLRDGPHGPGSVQAWVEPDLEHPFVDLVDSGTSRPGWVAVLSGEDEGERAVDVVHSTDPRVRQLALLDVVVNNSDRKGGHVLSHATAAGHLAYGIDHGLTFHVDPKLRTVLWGWIDEPLTDDEREALTHLLAELDGPLGSKLGALLDAAEIEATRNRTARLLAEGHFPAPDGGWPSVPWPAF